MTITPFLSLLLATLAVVSASNKMPHEYVQKQAQRAPAAREPYRQQKLMRQNKAAVTDSPIIPNSQTPKKSSGANDYGFEQVEKYAVFGSEGNGEGWFNSLRRRHHEEHMSSILAVLAPVTKDFVTSAPVTELKDRTRAYYWAEYDNQLYWTAPAMCRVRVNSDVCQSWTPAINRSMGFAEARDRPSPDVTVTLYFACDGTCCDVDCCKIDIWKIVWRIVHIWFIIMLVFWTCAGIHFLYIHFRQAQVDARQRRQPMWPKPWLNARKSKLRTKAVTDGDERKLLVEDVHYE